MKPTVYLDSTIPSYFFDQRESLRPFTEVTRRWVQEEIGAYDVWASRETLAELSEGRYPNKADILNWMKQFPLLPDHRDVLEIAAIYVQNYLMPRFLKGDAVHLAMASYYRMDFLLTWNCNHLANANKRRHLRILNARLNLAVPEIVTPMELFKEKSL